MSVKIEKTQRVCLKCHKPFPSESIGNRICSSCESKNRTTYNLKEAGIDKHRRYYSVDIDKESI